MIKTKPKIPPRWSHESDADLSHKRRGEAEIGRHRGAPGGREGRADTELCAGGDGAVTAARGGRNGLLPAGPQLRAVSARSSRQL